MVRGLLVDLDGTLADSIAPLKQVFFDFLLSHSIQSSEQEFCSYMGASLHEIVRDLRRKYSLEPHCEALYAQYSQNLLLAYRTAISAMPSAVDALELARRKGIKLALVTAASEEMAATFLAANELEGFFDALVCARASEAGKPAPDLYLRALAVLELTAEEAVAVEDSPNGIKSALAAGCRVLWLTPAGQTGFDGSVQPVRSWMEIVRWLEGV